MERRIERSDVDGTPWRRLWKVAALAAALVFYAAALSARAQEPDVYVWIEAEEPVESTFDFDVTSGGRPEVLSEGQWVHYSLSEDEAAERFPDADYRLTYEAEVPEAGTYQAWARVGFERVRAPFDWRIGDGEWQHADPDEWTTNVMKVAEWTEVAWLHLGEVELEPGTHRWELRYTEPDGRFIIGLDCLALTLGEWVPEGYLKPGERYDDELTRRAEEQVFRMPESRGAERDSMELSGVWEVARYDDPDMNVDTSEPVQAIPDPEDYPLRWMGLEVPGTLWDRYETIFGHRVFYRTRIDVPADYEGRGFVLRSWGTNWIVSVFVNGELADTHQSVWIPWQMDISDHIRPGEVNELVIAVKGSWYAVDPEHGGGPQALRNRPRDRARGARWIAPVYPSTKGDGDGRDSGLVNQMFLEATGDAYVEDVFVRPSVENSRLEADVTLRNTRPEARTVSVRSEAIYEGTGEVERRFDPVTVELPAGGTETVTIAGDWDDPRLWWPQTSPDATADLYDLRTTVSEGERALDVHEQRFGFREVTVRGTGIYINGKRRNSWTWVNVRGDAQSGEEWLEAFHSEGSRFPRFSAGRRTSNFLHSRTERLKFYDRYGIPGRLCSMIDGMFISYEMGHTRYGEDGEWELNPRLWPNLHRHIDQFTRAYRNHPSVITYQIENEFLYINGWNLYRRYWPKMAQGIKDIAMNGKENDPTRPMESGGSGDVPLELQHGGIEGGGWMSTNSPHYPEAAYDYYPDNAYALEHYSNKAAHWPWERDKPYIVGESRFARHLEDATIAIGDEAYRGMDYQRAGKARYLRALYGGYRWAGVAAWYPWDNLSEQEDALKMMSALCAIPRKQTHRLLGGARNELLFKMMNDTLSREPVTFEWSYEAGGERIAGETVEMDIEPGYGEQYTLVIDAPAVEGRLEGALTLRLSQPGGKSYEDIRDVPVVPAVNGLNVADPILLLDPNGHVEAFLAERDIPFESLESPQDLDERTGLALVGPDALTHEQAAERDDLRRFASRGGRVIVLEQENPVSGENVPVRLRTTERFGGYAHPQALGTPVYRDLGQEDLIDWAGDHPTYKRVYEKPAAGARSLAEAGAELPYSPLMEVPVGPGVIVLCQLRVGDKLGQEPAADLLLRNMVEYYAPYDPADGVAAVYSPDNPLLREKVRETGVTVRTAESLEQALDPARTEVLVVNASAENLERLIGLRGQVEAFQEAGGWIMLNGLSPEGIDAFNRLQGTDFILRPFRMERVTLEDRESPLAATLGNRDVALLSDDEIMHGRRWVYEHTFSYVLDAVQNAAPFTLPPDAPDDPFVYEPTYDDSDPYNFVNGMLGSDFWRYIQQIWWDDPEVEPLDLTFRLRRPETIDQVSIWNNTNYSTIEDIELIFDGDEDAAVPATLPDAPERTDLDLPQPVRAEETITIRLLTRRVRGTHANREHLVGIDNVEFRRAEAPESETLDNVGGLVAFPRGEGGLFVNQIKFMEDEPNPPNAADKVRLTSMLLQNMGVGTGEDVPIAGQNVRFSTVDLMPYGNHHIAASSWTTGRTVWFGEDGRDLRRLRSGEQTLADVTYYITDFHTAPVNEAVVLADGVPGLPSALQELPASFGSIRVEDTVDVVYLLHTAHVTRPLTDAERRAAKMPQDFPTVAYVRLNYADGESRMVPVRLEREVTHWLQDEPALLPGASLAWTHRYQDADNEHAVLYSMAVRNPRTDVEVRSLEFKLPEEERRAAYAVVGLTLGRRVTN